MKLRNAVAAALGALALTLSMSGSALAATGEFHYKFSDAAGDELSVTLPDPRSGECINLYAVDSYKYPPGYAPHNETDAWVTVYTDTNCDGDQWRLKPHGRQASDRLLVRSVRFDEPVEGHPAAR
ncbi:MULTISPECIES: hypothetical protein [unclassified Streptomyces]|uniref:hypothetical protein n=1 Tax=unclassified Streptomyces TaxID=2593676 RepID=UPI002250A943|nr:MULTISPECIES: hypothetical protein [unclassified Streptomyces]MCX4625287.1 hypothetical protein [Streptomyces sp. NBC_01443]WSW48894.1 hypothetical protein OG296_38075 [Streptomyces sp. NBC_01001]